MAVLKIIGEFLQINSNICLIKKEAAMYTPLNKLKLMESFQLKCTRHL